METLKAGDCVKLKSGGALMTVESTFKAQDGTEWCKCVWMPNGEVKREEFAVSSLIKA